MLLSLFDQPELFRQAPEMNDKASCYRQRKALSCRLASLVLIGQTEAPG